MSEYKVLRLEGVDENLDFEDQRDNLEAGSRIGKSSRSVDEIRVDKEISFNKANLRQLRKVIILFYKNEKKNKTGYLIIVIFNRYQY